MEERVNSSSNNLMYSQSDVSLYQMINFKLVQIESICRMKLGKMMIFVFDRIENIVGKGENAGDQQFLLFPQCFRES